MKCSKCNSKLLDFEKRVSYTKGVGLTYATSYKCRTCKYFKFFTRDKKSYELTKDLPWVKTKSYWKARKAGIVD